MAKTRIHRFEINGKRFAIDPETCFCFECDQVSWDVLEHYPEKSITAIAAALREEHPEREVLEVVGELEWLRSTDSILKDLKPSDLYDRFQLNTGLHTVTVVLGEEDSSGEADASAQTKTSRRGWFGRASGNGAQAPIPASHRARETASAAVRLLLNRSEKQQGLTLQFVENGRVRDADLLGELCREALRDAALAGKKLTVAVRIDDPAVDNLPEGLRGHRLSVRADFREPSQAAEQMKSFGRASWPDLQRIAKALQGEADAFSGRAIVQPESPDYAEAVPELHKAGFRIIELDLHGVYSSRPETQPSEMLPALNQTAQFYARRLLQGDYFQVHPLAGLFNQIHEGKPVSRSDPAGLNELAVSADGVVYPSRRMLGQEAFQVGNVLEGQLDEDRLSTFHDVGGLTTGVCRRCWARNLCGGGDTSVHHALSGSHRQPFEPWCEAQREWMESAVAAFNILSAEGVNFSRIYQSFGGSGKRLSLVKLARAALQTNALVRPIEEADAEMLVRWENWNDASYFVLHPRSLLLATAYDREMDAIHPETMEQEMVVTRRNGQPIGLVRMGPDAAPGVARAGLFLANEGDYAAADLARSFRFFLGEAGKQQEFRRVVVDAADREPALQGFLEKLGFKRAGTLRQALYLHGAHEDVGVYALDLN
jgi:uncharacterized protein